MTADDITNLLILRLLARPMSPTLWRIGHGASGWVKGFSDQWTYRCGNVCSSRWIYFQVPCDMAAMLLPDMYRRLNVPKTVGVVPDSVERRVRSAIRWNLDDELPEPSKDVLDNWETLSRNQVSEREFRSQYECKWDSDEFEIEDLSTKPREVSLLLRDPPMVSVVGSYLLTQRLSEEALSQIWLFPDEVLRTVFMCEGVMNPLYMYESAVIQTVCRGRATLTVRGAVQGP